MKTLKQKYIAGYKLRILTFSLKIQSLFLAILRETKETKEKKVCERKSYNDLFYSVAETGFCSTRMNGHMFYVFRY